MENWKFVQFSIRGKYHIETKLPNQDASGIYPEESELSGNWVASVADGHGAFNHYRSDVGSELAVQTFLEIGKLLIKRFRNREYSERQIWNYCENHLPRILVEVWRKKVRAHIAENILDKPEESDYIPYGTTLLGIVQYEEHLISVQIGDGEIVFLNYRNRMTRARGKDSDKYSYETDSLCDPDPLESLRVEFRKVTENFPKLILLSTDGFYNSLKTDKKLEKKIQEYTEYIEKNGWESFCSTIIESVSELSNSVSRDDTTMIWIYRSKLL